MVEVKNDFMKLFWEKNLKECWTKENVSTQTTCQIPLNRLEGYTFGASFAEKCPSI